MCSNTFKRLRKTFYSIKYIEASPRTCDCAPGDYWIILGVCVADTPLPSGSAWIVRIFKDYRRCQYFTVKRRVVWVRTEMNIILFTESLNQRGLCACVFPFLDNRTGQISGRIHQPFICWALTCPSYSSFLSSISVLNLTSLHHSCFSSNVNFLQDSLLISSSICFWSWAQSANNSLLVSVDTRKLAFLYVSNERIQMPRSTECWSASEGFLFSLRENYTGGSHAQCV